MKYCYLLDTFDTRTAILSLLMSWSFASNVCQEWQERRPQVSEFLFGDGFAVSGGDGWRVRRKAVGPSLHRAYLETMISRVFAPSATHLNSKLQVRLGWTQQLSDNCPTTPVR